MLSRFLSRSPIADQSLLLFAVSSIVVFHSLNQALKVDEGDAIIRVVNVGIATTVVSLLFIPRRQQTACIIGAGLAGWRLYIDFPSSANHTFLEFLIFSLAVACGPGGADYFNKLCPKVAGAVLAWSGVQKIAYGAFPNGATLAFLARSDTRFEWLEGLLEAGSEFGCKDVPVIFAVLGSSICFAEICVGLALLTQRLKTYAIIFAMFMLAGIEIFAREYAFGGLMFAILGVGHTRMIVVIEFTLILAFVGAFFWNVLT